jgi:hypothetical protein
MNRLINLVYRHPLAVILCFAAAFVAAGFVHNRYAYFDFSFRTMAPRGTVELQRADEFEEIFGRGSNMYLVVFRHPDALSQKHLALVDRLTTSIEALEATASVLSVTNANDVRALDDALDVGPFIESLPLSPTDHEAAVERLMADVLLHNTLFSPDGTTVALLVRLHEPRASGDEATFLKANFEQLEELLAEEAPGVEFYLVGIPYQDSVLFGHVNSDTARVIPLGMLLLGGMLWLAFRRVRAVWMPLLAISVASVLTLGVMSGAGVPMAVLTGNGVMILLVAVIALSSAVHVMNRYEEDLVAAGGDPDRSRAALGVSMRHVGRACLLTSVTTAVGLASLASSDIPNIRQFGLVGAAGIVFAWAASVVLLPSLMVLAGRRKPPTPRVFAASDRLGRLLDGTTRLVLARPRALVTVTLLLAAGALWIATNVEIDNRYRRDLFPDDPTVLAMDFVDEHLSGAFPLDIMVRGSQPDAVKDPQVLRAMDEVAQALATLPAVSRVNSPVPWIRKMNRAMSGDDPAFDRVPDSAEAVAQYLLLFEMAGSDSEFDRMVSYDYSTARMTAMTTDLKPDQFDQLITEFRRLVEEADFPEGVEVFEAGGTPLFHSLTGRLITTLLRSLYIAVPVVLLVIAWSFRSVRLAALSVLPNILPLTLGLALLGLAGISLRFTTIIAFPLAFGLAVDDTIHFLARWREERARGRDNAEAIRLTMRSTGRAMVLTTAFLTGALAVMMVSEFLGLVHMSLLVMVILFGALLGDLLLLPALLALFAGDQVDVTGVAGHQHRSTGVTNAAGDPS